MIGHIFNIQKFCLHDGPGIRTTVFFKGCNLRCRWCANPESQCREREMTLDEEKCTGCGACVTACGVNARTIRNGKLLVDSRLCVACGSCVAACPSRAIGREGRKVTSEEVLAEAVKDKPFYETSGGGVTLSGGEAALQLPFATALSRALHKEGIHVAVETAGAVPPEAFSSLLQEMDYVLMDLKHYDSAAHRAGTGVENTQIIENLRALSQSGVPFLVRIPVIPGFNDGLEDAHGFAKLLSSMGIDRVQLLPFHQLGQHKYRLLRRPYDYAGVSQLQPEALQHMAEIFASYGIHANT